MKSFVIFLKQGGCFVRIAQDISEAIESIIPDDKGLTTDDIAHIEECENSSYMCKYKQICI
ncbi:MAG TPA: hypothetical protein VK426_06130 [Methanobacterium sp.]|nr:hypothetical protein [Methanobacterium sp.]